MEEKKQIKLKAGLNADQNVLLIKIESDRKLKDQEITKSLSQYLAKGQGIPDGESYWIQEFSFPEAK